MDAIIKDAAGDPIRCPWCGAWLVASAFGFGRCSKCERLVTRQEAERMGKERAMVTKP